MNYVQLDYLDLALASFLVLANAALSVLLNLSLMGLIRSMPSNTRFRSCS